MSVDGPIDYLPRIRTYYQALGYGTPYEWAHFDDVPFLPLTKPLSSCRVTLVTTAAPYQPGKGDQGQGAAYNASAKFYSVYSDDTSTDPDLCISHVAIDRKHTTAEDINSYFPLKALRRSVARGRVGGLTNQYHGLPTNRSKSTTIDVDSVELVARCKADGADAAILVANCPVCHQSVGLAARALESNGIATVIMGCARDIVEHVGVPRFLFNDFPLGNGAGKPNDAASQDLITNLALDLLETAVGPRITLQSPVRWSDDPDWKLDYCNIERLTAEEIRQRRAAFDAAKSVAKSIRSES